MNNKFLELLEFNKKPVLTLAGNGKPQSIKSKLPSAVTDKKMRQFALWACPDGNNYNTPTAPMEDCLWVGDDHW